MLAPLTITGTLALLTVTQTNLTTKHARKQSAYTGRG
jgi:hypothetical protein